MQHPYNQWRVVPCVCGWELGMQITFIRGDLSLMVIVIQNGIGEPNSNSGRNCWRFICTNALEEIMTPSFLLPTAKLFVNIRQAVSFALFTQPVKEWKPWIQTSFTSLINWPYDTTYSRRKWSLNTNSYHLYIVSSLSTSGERRVTEA